MKSQRNKKRVSKVKRKGSKLSKTQSKSQRSKKRVANHHSRRKSKNDGSLSKAPELLEKLGNNLRFHHLVSIQLYNFRVGPFTKGRILLLIEDMLDDFAEIEELLNLTKIDMLMSIYNILYGLIPSVLTMLDTEGYTEYQITRYETLLTILESKIISKIVSFKEDFENGDIVYRPETITDVNALAKLVKKLNIKGELANPNPWAYSLYVSTNDRRYNYISTNIAEFVNLKILDFDWGQKDISLEGLYNLETLNLYQTWWVYALNDLLYDLINLKTLKLGGWFNSKLNSSLHPLKRLEILEFGNMFNQPLDDSLTNLKQLKTLKFGFAYDTPLNSSLDGLVNLEYLEFGDFYRQPLDNSLKYLSNLKTLKFIGQFNSPVGVLKNLKKLETLEFGYYFEQPLEDLLSELTKLKTLNLGSCIPKGSDLNHLVNLESLTVTKLLDSVNLKNLKSLHMMGDFNSPLASTLNNLVTLENLEFGNMFNQLLDTSLDKLTNLKTLTLGPRFNKPLGTSLRKLVQLEHISFKCMNFSQNLENELKFLPNLKTLKFFSLNADTRWASALPNLTVIYEYR